ncbi:MAG: sugar transferase [Coriobacteriaceae bacterium]|nr:MAG: sugar transferase [Coriobacteriaceae bacterium]
MMEQNFVAEIGNLNMDEEESCPGSHKFAKLSASLDRRGYGYRFIKRTFDIVFSGLVIAVGLLSCVVLSVAIAIDTKGKPIYSQVRVGRYGMPFRIYKFRSMVNDSDDVEKYFTPQQLETWKRERKVDNDPRITKLGRVLRKTSIDELPQFINVLLGQISVIGPRPITYDELEHFGDNAALFCSVPGGITGLWQSSKRNVATFESGERQVIELSYVEKASTALDARCFFNTFGVMFGKEKTGR